ncbi:uncharacterized protein TNCV_4341481 [Trichonephila clavipes]|nr:uncharacterized protein TNCV_4341481 [Trichonephila clavipes]
MPRFCNKTFKRRKFGANYKDSSASEDLNKGQEPPANSSENFCEIIDIPLFSSVLKQHVLCLKCKKQGIDIKFGRQIQDTKVYEVNTRLAYAMRSVGKGEAAAKVFCGVMNLPPPPKRFYESLHPLNNATEKVAKVSMALAAAEKLSFNNGNPNVPVAIDGTWQKRDHTSLNGVVTAVSVDTGKVVDAEILSRKCSCHFNGNLHSDECSANYLGNSGGMEVEAYKAVLESKPYKDVNIEKLECVGHVEKRMGTRLRALKLKLKGKKLEDKKSLGDRNRLTDAEIDKLQRYYGLAIRNNSGNLSAMKQAIWAIFFHKISTDLNPQHGLCPLGDDSWCGYNRSKLKGDTYKHEHNLPIAIMHCIKKVFKDLSSPELLSRCLHGKTQNCNESLNSVIWSIIPKTVFVQLGTLKTGVYEFISIYNQGLVTKLKVSDLLNIQPGFYTCRALQEAYHARIRKVEKAISRRTKEARIKNRQLKCRQEDDLTDDPRNPPYGSECEGYNFDKLKLLIDNGISVLITAINGILLSSVHKIALQKIKLGFRSIPTSLWPPPAKKSAPCACSGPWVHFRENFTKQKREIGSRVGRNQTTVMRICDRWMQEGTTDRRGRSHPPQCTTSREDRQIVRMAVTDRSITSRTIAQHIESITHHSVSARTIRRRLQQSGLSARSQLLGLPLTQNHRRFRHQ